LLRTSNLIFRRANTHQNFRFDRPKAPSSVRAQSGGEHVEDAALLPLLPSHGTHIGLPRGDQMAREWIAVLQPADERKVTSAGGKFRRVTGSGAVHGIDANHRGHQCAKPTPL
jgi:hypothetical protein